MTAAKDARGIGVNVLGLVAQAALPAFHVQLARYLGAGGYGAYTWSSTFVDLFSVVTLFGMDQAVVREVSLAGAAHDRSRAAASVGTALRVVVLSGFVVALGVWVGAPSIAAFQSKPSMVEPLRALAIVPLFYHIATILLAATQSLGVMRWAFWARSIAQPLVLFAATSVALRSGAGSGGAALAVAGGMGATAVLAALAYARELPLGATLRAAFVSPLDRTTLRLASPLLAANLLWALLSRLDAFVLGHYVSIEQLGAYSACGLYAASISQLRGAFDPVTSSLVAPALARGDVAGLAAAIERQTHWLALAAFPLLGTFVGFGGPLLRVFGRDFDGGVVALGVLAVGHTANALALASFTLPLSGHGRYTTIVAACALVVQGAACAILVPRFGIVGGACALALGFVGAQTAQLVIAKRVVGVLGLSPRLLVTLACTAVAIVAARGVFAVVTGGLAVRCIVALGAAAVIYIVLVWKLVLRRAEL